MRYKTKRFVYLWICSARDEYRTFDSMQKVSDLCNSRSFRLLSEDNGVWRVDRPYTLYGRQCVETGYATVLEVELE